MSREGSPDWLHTFQVLGKKNHSFVYFRVKVTFFDWWVALAGSKLLTRLGILLGCNPSILCSLVFSLNVCWVILDAKCARVYFVFQVPTTESLLSLSSDSESSLNGLPSGKDKTDGQEPSPRKSSGFDEDEDVDKVSGVSVAGSPSVKRLKGKSPKQGKKVEGHTPQKRKNSDVSKKREGKTRAMVEKPSKPHVSIIRLLLFFLE